MGRNGAGILNPALAVAYYLKKFFNIYHNRVIICSGSITGNDFYGY